MKNIARENNQGIDQKAVPLGRDRSILDFRTLGLPSNPLDRSFALRVSQIPPKPLSVIRRRAPSRGRRPSCEI